MTTVTGLTPAAISALIASSVASGAPVGLAPSGDTSGATDHANIAGLITLAGQAVIQPGSFHINNTVSLIQAQNITGPGSALCTIYATSAVTGPAIQVALSGSFTGGAYGGKLSGFGLDGYSAGSGADGIKLENLQGLDIEDVSIYGFGHAGLYFFNSSGDWAEQHTVRARLVQNGTAALFDHSSFDYSNFDLTVVTGNGQGVVTIENGAQMAGPNLRLRGNCYGSSGNTAAVINIDPGNSAGTSYFLNAQFDVVMETAGSDTGHYLVNMGSANASSQFFGEGTLVLSSVGPASQGINNPNYLPFGFTGTYGDREQGSILSYGYEWCASTDGTNTSDGAVVLRPYQRWFGIYDSTAGLYYGISKDLPSPSGTSTLGGYYHGLGVGGSSAGAGNPIFGVLNSGQSGEGINNTAFTILDNNKVYTFKNTLDDGSGNANFAGLLSASGGTDTSATAAASSPSFTSNTPKQVSTTQDVMLYIAIQTSAALSVAIGPTSTPANTIMPSKSYALGMATVRVPKGWYVNIVGTIADLTITQVTC